MPPVQIDKGTISVALLGGILGTAILGTWRFAVWSTRVETRLDILTEKVDEALADRWRGSDMTRWTALLREQNPTLTIPVPYTH